MQDKHPPCCSIIPALLSAPSIEQNSQPAKSKMSVEPDQVSIPCFSYTVAMPHFGVCGRTHHKKCPESQNGPPRYEAIWQPFLMCSCFLHSIPTRPEQRPRRAPLYRVWGSSGIHQPYKELHRAWLGRSWGSRTAGLSVCLAMAGVSPISHSITNKGITRIFWPSSFSQRQSS